MEKMSFKLLFEVSVSAFGFLFASISLLQFAKYLSYLPSSNKLKGQHETVTNVIWLLFVNVLLISGFVVQHSFMLNSMVKGFILKIGLPVLERSIYVIFSCISLQILMSYWNIIPSVIIWKVDVEGSGLLWWIYTLVHCFVWIQIYIELVAWDYFELFGVKQVYYHMKGWEDPLSYKSKELRRLFRHIRHPSFLGFSIIFWIYPLMSIDRLLMSVMLSLYMLIAWNPDNLDYLYVRDQLKQ